MQKEIGETKMSEKLEIVKLKGGFRLRWVRLDGPNGLKTKIQDAIKDLNEQCNQTGVPCYGCRERVNELRIVLGWLEDKQK